jgi:hypothetical protein
MSIVFCGDSFAAWSEQATGNFQHTTRHKYPSYLDLVSRDLGIDYHCFGYGTKSWWYSRCKMFDYMDANPKIWEKVDTVVITHTSDGRFPSSEDAVSLYDIGNFKKPAYMIEALDTYYTKLVDCRFHSWAQERFVDECATKFRDRKIINFICFSHEMYLLDKMPGMSCTIPLFALSAAEFDTAGDANLAYSHAVSTDMSHETRVCHFSAANNRALADSITWAITNYAPGLWDLELSKFQIADLKNLQHFTKN